MQVEFVRDGRVFAVMSTLFPRGQIVARTEALAALERAKQPASSFLARHLSRAFTAPIVRLTRPGNPPPRWRLLTRSHVGLRPRGVLVGIGRTNENNHGNPECVSVWKFLDPVLASLQFWISHLQSRLPLQINESTVCSCRTALKRIRLGSWRHCETH